MSVLRIVQITVVLLSLALIGPALSVVASTTADPQLNGETDAAEITAMILKNQATSNRNNQQVKGVISKDGSVEFWSSGGLRQHVKNAMSLPDYASLNIMVASDTLSRALKSTRVPRQVLYASRKVGGMGGKDMRRIRDEAVLTLLLTVLNTPGSTTAAQLEEALLSYGTEKQFGCGVNGDPPETTTYYCDRIARMLKENGMQLQCRTEAGTRPTSRNTRQVLGLPPGGAGHATLIAKRRMDTRVAFRGGRWTSTRMDKEGKKEIEEALAKLATQTGKHWTLTDCPAAAALTRSDSGEQLPNSILLSRSDL